MQLYLCEKYDKDNKISFKYDSDEYWESVEWLVWMVNFFGNSTINMCVADLKHSKVASALCRGRPTTFIAVSFLHGLAARPKLILAVQMPQKRSPTQSTATKQRPSASTQSSTIVSPQSGRRTTSLLAKPRTLSATNSR